MDLRATLRLRNDKMIAARERLGLSQKQVAELAGVHVCIIGSLESLRFADVFGNSAQKASRVAGVLELEPEDVMPAELVGKSIQTEHVRRFSAPVASLLPEYNRFNLPSPSDAAAEGELSDSVDRVLRTLTNREREILKVRFGFGLDGETMSLEAIAKTFGITRERVRQIEAKAIRKLQHPARAKLLESFLPGGLMPAGDSSECEGERPASCAEAWEPRVKRVEAK